jgi:hypothetical protein
MVLAQAPHRLPELLFGGPAEDFGRVKLTAVQVRKPQLASPSALIGETNAEVKGDGLIGETERGQLVKDRLSWVESIHAVWPSRHCNSSGGRR